MTWFKEHYHYVAIGFWILAIPPTIIFWNKSVLWVSLMSLYANIWISLSVIVTKENA